jgi:predicted HicB family RNase H-like nuclease
MGRPPLPNGEAKGVVFQVRLTERERDELSAAAKRAGRPLTQWARETLLTAASLPARAGT